MGRKQEKGKKENGGRELGGLFSMQREMVFKPMTKRHDLTVNPSLKETQDGEQTAELVPS